MTDEQIIKALECDTHTNCEECPYWHEFCEPNNVTAKDILDLINRQKAESENQSENFKRLVAEHMELQKAFELANSELFFRRLENCELADNIEKAEVEAIKEFAERLKDKQQTFISDEYAYKFIYLIEIDNLVKEMVGESNV